MDPWISQVKLGIRRSDTWYREYVDYGDYSESFGFHEPECAEYRRLGFFNVAKPRLRICNASFSEYIGCDRPETEVS